MTRACSRRTGCASTRRSTAARSAWRRSRCAKGSRSSRSTTRACIPSNPLARFRAASWRCARRPASCSRWWGAATTPPRSSIAVRRRAVRRGAPSSRSSTPRRSSRTGARPRSRSRTCSTIRRWRSRRRAGRGGPRTTTRRWHGMVTVRQAIEKSLNVATARLARDVGSRRVADLARRTGIQSPLPIVPSLALGVASVAPIEIARAYATFASGGIRPELQSIEDLIDAEGHTLERRKLRFERVIDAGTAYLVTSLLQGVADRGTAAALRANGSARSDRRQDRDHRSRAGPLAGRLHAGAGGRGVDRLRRAAQPQDPEQPGGASDLAALRAGHDGRRDPRPLPEAGERRGDRDRSRDAGAWR